MPLRPQAVEGWVWRPGPVVRLVWAPRACASGFPRKARGGSLPVRWPRSDGASRAGAARTAVVTSCRHHKSVFQLIGRAVRGPARRDACDDAEDGAFPANGAPGRQGVPFGGRGPAAPW